MGYVAEEVIAGFCDAGGHGFHGAFAFWGEFDEVFATVVGVGGALDEVVFDEAVDERFSHQYYTAFGWAFEPFNHVSRIR